MRLLYTSLKSIIDDKSPHKMAENKHECAMDQELTSHALGGLAAEGGRCCTCSSERRADVK